MNEKTTVQDTSQDIGVGEEDSKKFTLTTAILAALLFLVAVGSLF